MTEGFISKNTSVCSWETSSFPRQPCERRSLPRAPLHRLGTGRGLAVHAGGGPRNAGKAGARRQTAPLCSQFQAAFDLGSDSLRPTCRARRRGSGRADLSSARRTPGGLHAPLRVSPPGRGGTTMLRRQRAGGSGPVSVLGGRSLVTNTGDRVRLAVVTPVRRTHVSCRPHNSYLSCCSSDVASS